MHKSTINRLSFLKDNLLLLINIYLKPKRKPYKYSIEEKLDGVIYVVTSGISWSQLDKKGDESTYRKFYYTLIDNDVLKNAFDDLIKNSIELELVKTNELYIDSTSIINKLGSTNIIDFGFLPKKHKSLKIHTIVTYNQVPLAIEFSKGSEHDVNYVEPLVESLNKIKSLKNSKLMGDKAYVSKKTKITLKKKYKVKLIYQKRKNQSNNNTIADKKKLKKRHCVENTFATLKKYRKVDNVYDRKLENYKGTVYLAVILMIFIKFKKKKEFMDFRKFK